MVILKLLLSKSEMFLKLVFAPVETQFQNKAMHLPLKNNLSKFNRKNSRSVFFINLIFNLSTA